MDPLVALYIAQPFWIWLGLGAVLLAVEASIGSEWLLWPAVSAGALALLTLTGVRLGFGIELALFAGLTIVTTVTSQRLLKRVNPQEPDINDQHLRLIGLRAQITQPFVDGRGRVSVSGSDWPAEIEGEAPPVGASVLVEAVRGPVLVVRPA